MAMQGATWAQAQVPPPPTHTRHTRAVHFSFGFFDDGMPASVAAAIKQVSQDHPLWTVKVWGPAESRALVAERYPEFLATYDAYLYPIQRSDASRYFILHAHGGLYMDVDYRLAASLETILVDMDARAPAATVFLNETPNSAFGQQALSNSFMYARAPGHPFWLAARDQMAASTTSMVFSRYFHVMFTTGPNMLTNAFLRYSACGVGGVAVLPKAAYNPCSMCCTTEECLVDRAAAAEGEGALLAYHENKGTWSNTGLENAGRLAYCYSAFVLPLAVALITAMLVAVTRSTARVGTVALAKSRAAAARSHLFRAPLGGRAGTLP